jgi:hypothetical protein
MPKQKIQQNAAGSMKQYISQMKTIRVGVPEEVIDDK